MADPMKSTQMIIQFCRLPETWPATAQYDSLRRQGKKPPSHAYARLLTDESKVIDWNPTSPDERLFMLSQIQVDLRDTNICEEVLQGLEGVERGGIPYYSYCGAGWDMVARLIGVEFEYFIMDAEPGGKVSLETYRKAVEKWREFLADEDCDERILELPDA